MDKSSRVLISGAGVAGLTAAIWLGRKGFKPVIVEQAADVRADGYIISLSHRSYRYADALELLPELEQRSAGVMASSYHRAGGAALLEFDYARLFDGVNVIQIMRDDLQDILYDKAKDLAEFRFDTSVSGIDHGEHRAEVSFSDGSKEEYEAVIGADGLHSAVRRLAFNESDVRMRFLGLCSAAYGLPNIFDLEHKFETHMERDRYMVVFTTPAGALATVFVWRTALSEAPPAAERRQVLIDAYADTRSFTRQVLEHCPGDGVFYMDPLVQIRMNQWHCGQSVLVGDAAHCMTLISGQGATMAFTGACALAERLVALPTGKAFHAYQQDLQTTVFDVQDRTRRMARWYVPCSIWRQALRDAAMWLLPTAYFENHFKAKYSRA
ncbi:MAG: FAD-dependent monooxygenase [Pseudomonadota bacterium]|nr:FAD-dependent monooxygenase [Pseudomonadota bacterium]